jgi:hypothetical protein
MLVAARAVRGIATPARLTARHQARSFAAATEPEDDDTASLTPQQRERKIILSRFSGSKISDAMRADRDKQFQAAPALLSASEVFAMPDLEMEQLFEESKTESLRALACSNVATLFTVSFTQHARKQLGAVHSAFLDTYGLESASLDDRVPGVGLVDCSYANGMLFSIFRSMMLPGTRAAIPEPMQPFAYAKFEGSERATEVRAPCSATQRLRPFPIVRRQRSFNQCDKTGGGAWRFAGLLL